MATYNLYGATSNGINLDSRLNYVPEGSGPPPTKVPSGADIVNQNPAGEFFYTHQGVSFSSFTGRGGSLAFGT